MHEVRQGCPRHAHEQIYLSREYGGGYIQRRWPGETARQVERVRHRAPPISKAPTRCARPTHDNQNRELPGHCLKRHVGEDGE